MLNDCFSFRCCSKCRYNLSAMVACYNKYRRMKTLFNCKSFLLLQFLNWSKRGKHNPSFELFSFLSLPNSLTCLPLPAPPPPVPVSPTLALHQDGLYVLLISVGELTCACVRTERKSLRTIASRMPEPSPRADPLSGGTCQ